jgi:hypothetical protein
MQRPNSALARGDRRFRKETLTPREEASRVVGQPTERTRPLVRALRASPVGSKTPLA